MVSLFFQLSIGAFHSANRVWVGTVAPRNGNAIHGQIYPCDHANYTCLTCPILGSSGTSRRASRSSLQAALAAFATQSTSFSTFFFSKINFGTKFSNRLLSFRCGPQNVKQRLRLTMSVESSLARSHLRLPLLAPLWRRRSMWMCIRRVSAASRLGLSRSLRQRSADLVAPAVLIRWLDALLLH